MHWVRLGFNLAGRQRLILGWMPGAKSARESKNVDMTWEHAGRPLWRRWGPARLVRPWVLLVAGLSGALLVAPAAAKARVTVTKVRFLGSPSNPTVTVRGSGFGGQPRGASAASGYTGKDFGNALYLCDSASNPNAFCAGQGAGGGSGDLIGLAVSRYTSHSIVFRLGSNYRDYYYPNNVFRLAAGDRFVLHVKGTTCIGTANFSGKSITCFRASHPVTRLAPITYTAQDGHQQSLVPWQGRYVTVLVEPSPARDPSVMTELVNALDRAWYYYALTTGRTPASDSFMLNGRDEIAEVSSLNPPNSCGGAACSYLGADGTEILTQYFEYGYQEILQHNLFDQPLFYELGRTFWFWTPQLAFRSPDQDPVVTGFAVLMRFRSMAAAGVSGAPYNGSTPFYRFRAGVRALAGEYEANPALTFAQTLAQDRSPGAYGGTDFWASLMLQLAHRHGGQLFLSRFFHHAGSLPAASSTAGAVANWVRDADYAACLNLAPVFYRRWGFPQPNGHVNQRPKATSVPEPRGSCR
jgi:hypothetical protein